MATLEQASVRHVLDAQSRNLTPDRIKFIEQVHQRYLAFLRERHPELGASPPVTALTIDNARDFTAWLKTHTGRNPLSGERVTKGSTTIRAHLVDLKALSRFCSDEGLLPDYPLAKLKTPRTETKVIETFKAHHLEAMLRVVGGQLQRDRNRAIIYLLLATGMRASPRRRRTSRGQDRWKRSGSTCSRNAGRRNSHHHCHLGKMTVVIVTISLR